MIRCINCNHEVELNFCPGCGQKATVKRIELTELISSVPHAIFHIDRGILYNIKSLAARPGKSIRDYIKGKRIRFMNPVTYLAVLLFCNYLAVKITDLRFYDEPELTKLSPAEVYHIKQYDENQRWFLENSYLYMLIAIPLSTLVFYSIFLALRLKFNIAEIAIIIMFIVAQGVLYQTIIYFVAGWIKNGLFIRTVESFVALVLISYSTFSFYKLALIVGKKWKQVAGSIVLGFLLLLIMVASTYFVAWIFS
jgi:hypothetical protein